MAEASDGSGAGMLLFLAWAGDRGELNLATAKAFAASVRSVLSLEAEPDSVEMREIDVESMLDRFETLNRTKYSTGSMSTYKSRFRQSVAMYLAWLEKDPNWKTAAKPGGSNGSKRSAGRKAGKTTTSTGSGDKAMSEQDMPSAILPRLVAYDMPLRPDMIVRLTLPIDLTRADAERVATFVRSLAFVPESSGAASATRTPTREEE